MADTITDIPRRQKKRHNHRQHGRHRHWQKSRKFVLELLTKEEPFFVMKSDLKALLLAIAAAVSISGQAGCSMARRHEPAATSETTAQQTEFMTAAAEGAAPEGASEAETRTEGWQYKEAALSLLIDSNVSLDGLNAVCDLAKEKLGITINIEYKVDDSVLKTRLAAGEMTDLVVYNSGSLLKALNPSEYFMDLTGQPFTDKYDDIYRDSVTVDGAVYGIPFASTQAGAVMYYKPIYEELNLEVPHTWDQFLANCQAVKDSGHTAYISATAGKSMTQVLLLGDHYNVAAADPDFTAEFEKGAAGYATCKAAMKSWKNYEDVIPYLQEDHETTTYEQACDLLAQGKGIHWVCLTQALSNIYSMYGKEAADQIGVFGIPGLDENDHGLTVWMPNSLYGSLTSDKQDDILRFMEFYVSDEALNAYAQAILPDGPYCIKGYSLPEGSYAGVKEDMQAYFDKGKTKVAMEFETAVKGANCSVITQSLISGEITGEMAARQYDEDCRRQAAQMGFEWN